MMPTWQVTEKIKHQTGMEGAPHALAPEVTSVPLEGMAPTSFALPPDG